MTAGVADVQQELDIDLESNICKLVTLNVSRFILDKCTMLAGSKWELLTLIVLENILTFKYFRAYDADSQFHILSNDIQAFTQWEGSDDILKTMIGSTGFMQVALDGDIADEVWFCLSFVVISQEYEKNNNFRMEISRDLTGKVP